jgi:hypothetical protein
MLWYDQLRDHRRVHRALQELGAGGAAELREPGLRLPEHTERIVRVPFACAYACRRLFWPSRPIRLTHLHVTTNPSRSCASKNDNCGAVKPKDLGDCKCTGYNHIINEADECTCLGTQTCEPSVAIKCQTGTFAAVSGMPMFQWGFITRPTVDTTCGLGNTEDTWGCFCAQQGSSDNVKICCGPQAKTCGTEGDECKSDPCCVDFVCEDGCALLLARACVCVCFLRSSVLMRRPFWCAQFVRAVQGSWGRLQKEH